MGGFALNPFSCGGRSRYLVVGRFFAFPALDWDAALLDDFDVCPWDTLVLAREPADFSREVALFDPDALRFEADAVVFAREEAPLAAFALALPFVRPAAPFLVAELRLAARLF